MGKIKNVLIYGAGELGVFIQRLIMSKKINDYMVIGFIDDSIIKSGNIINNQNIYSSIEVNSSFLEKKEISAIILAIRDLDEKIQEKINNKFSDLNIPLLSPPDIDFWVQNGLKSEMIKPLNYSSFINRKKINLDLNLIKNFYDSKTILVTGAAGSIGSEICKQITTFNIKKIILVDSSETGVFNLLEDIKKFKTIDFHLISVTNTKSLEKVFEKNDIDVVFHAAAYKHVNICEINYSNCIYNNVLGTINTIDLAIKYNCKKFVLISTDKAVNPKSIMGISKRLCELYCLSISNTKIETDIVITRFGNVLGSNGSVLKIFENRFISNLPLQVTDKKMTRYFMSIFEACQLVIYSGQKGSNSEICIFEMGTPQNIFKLAEKFIISKGLIPHEQYKINIIGAGSSEKINEELFSSYEELEKKEDEKILILKSKTNPKIKDMIKKDYGDPDSLSYEEIKDIFKKYL